jgi:hypothetical protein
VTDPAPQPVYQSLVYSVQDLPIEFTLSDIHSAETLTVRLHFAPVSSWMSLSNTEMDVDVNGTTVLHNPYVSPGGANKATVLTFTGVSPVQNKIEILILNRPNKYSILSGIQIIAE